MGKMKCWLTMMAYVGCSTAGAQTAARAAVKPAAAPAPKSVAVISPVFHQLVAYSLPSGFDLKPSEQVTGKSFLRETVLRGQTVEKWTQMVTLSGAEGAVTGGLTAQHMVEAMAGGYQHACPDSFAFKLIGALTVSGQPAYLALASCGSVPDTGGAAGAMHSESALLLGLAGSQDMYTVQWAVRGTPSQQPLPFNDAAWQARFQALQPIRVCDPVPGEKAPFSSCLK